MPLGTRQLGIEKEIRDEYARKRLAFEKEMELIKGTREEESSQEGERKHRTNQELQEQTTTLTDTLYATTPLTIPHLLHSLHALRNTTLQTQHALLSQRILYAIRTKLLFGYPKSSLMANIDKHVSHIANTRPDIRNSGFWDNYYARVKMPEGRFSALRGCKEKVTVLAMGICVLVAPWVIRDLGFLGLARKAEDGKEERDLGCVYFVEEGSFAAQWLQRCNGEIDKAMMYSYFLELGMVWD